MEAVAELESRIKILEALDQAIEKQIKEEEKTADFRVYGTD